MSGAVHKQTPDGEQYTIDMLVSQRIRCNFSLTSQARERLTLLILTALLQLSTATAATSAIIAIALQIGRRGCNEY